MPDRVADLVLELAAESGALALFVLFYEMKAIANGAEFTTPEVCAHAKVPGNCRLRDAITTVCDGEIDPRKLARVLSRYRDRNVGLGYVVSQVGTDRGWILWKFAAVDLSFAAKVATNDTETLLCSES